MRTESESRTEGNEVHVYGVTWDRKNPLKKGKTRIGSIPLLSREAAVLLYKKKEAAGLNPILRDFWVAGFAF